MAVICTAAPSWSELDCWLLLLLACCVYPVLSIVRVCFGLWLAFWLAWCWFSCEPSHPAARDMETGRRKGRRKQASKKEKLGSRIPGNKEQLSAWRIRLRMRWNPLLVAQIHGRSHTHVVGPSMFHGLNHDFDCTTLPSLIVTPRALADCTRSTESPSASPTSFALDDALLRWSSGPPQPDVVRPLPARRVARFNTGPRKRRSNVDWLRANFGPHNHSTR